MKARIDLTERVVTGYLNATPKERESFPVPHPRAANGILFDKIIAVAEEAGVVAVRLDVEARATRDALDALQFQHYVVVDRGSGWAGLSWRLRWLRNRLRWRAIKHDHPS